MDYMHARYESPVTGRFLSVDPGGTDPSEPQSWNRYTYAAGNPLIFLDRDGENPALAVAVPVGLGLLSIWAIHHAHQMNVNEVYRHNVMSPIFESRRTGRQIPSYLEGYSPEQLKQMLAEAAGKLKQDIIKALKERGERNKQKARGGRREPKKEGSGDSTTQKLVGTSTWITDVNVVEINQRLGYSLSDLELLLDAGILAWLDEERAAVCGIGVQACPF